MPKNKKADEKELQAKYIQTQLMKQQANAMLEERNAVAERISELNTTIDALHKLEEVKGNSEIWSSLGAGSFVLSDIKDIENVMVAIGAGVVVKEKRERAIEIMQSRLEEMNTIEKELSQEIAKLAQEINRLEEELQNMVKDR